MFIEVWGVAEGAHFFGVTPPPRGREPCSRSEQLSATSFPKKGLSKSVTKTLLLVNACSIKIFLKHHNVTKEKANLATRRERQNKHECEVCILHCI